jgi:arylsulfatase A-like enzyme
MAISWPKVDKGGIRNQSHLIDIVPTILDATGIKAPDIVDNPADLVVRVGPVCRKYLHLADEQLFLIRRELIPRLQ